MELKGFSQGYLDGFETVDDHLGLGLGLGLGRDGVGGVNHIQRVLLLLLLVALAKISTGTVPNRVLPQLPKRLAHTMQDG